MKNKLFSKILRYIAQATIVYLLFRFLPKTPMSQQETLMIVAGIMLTYILLENLCAIYLEEEPIEKFEFTSSCPSKCNNITTSNSVEHMADVQPIPPVTATPVPTPVPTPVSTPEPKQQEANSVKAEKTAETITIKYKPSSNTKSTVEASSSQTKSGDFADSNQEQNSKDDVYKNKPASQDEIITNEMKYTDYNHLPIGDNYSNVRDYQNGYSFLPPDKWYPQPPFPPLCHTEKQCPVCPMLTTGGPVDLLEWDRSRRVTPPDNIKIDYIKDKLNSGH